MQVLVAPCESRTASLLLAFGVLALVGCGTDLPLAPVSGTVTFEGQPLAGASITTQPIGVDSDSPGSGSFGQTDDQGRFELELVKPAVKGAIIGEHRVIITPKVNDGSAKGPQTSADGDESWKDDPNSHRAMAGNKWPASFSDGSLRLVVPPDGAADVHLDLKR
jgi:hypothetical protein